MWLLKDNSKGFTLIELLVTVGIIGILASIAIPQFSDYREKAYDSAAISDVRGMMIAQEAYYIDSEVYGTCTGSAACQSTLPGFNTSNHVGVFATSIGANSQGFTAASCTIRGTKPTSSGFATSSSASAGRKQFTFSTQSAGNGIFAANVTVTEAVCAGWDDD